MTYAEYLKQNGATDEDIKVLDNPIARKGFEALQRQAADASAAAKAATDAQAADRAELEKWYQEQQVPAYQKMQNELVAARANEAKAKAAVMALQKQGLIDVAKDLGYDAAPTAGTPPANPGAVGFDASKYVTTDAVVALAEQEGDAIALAQDIAFEHRTLFPDKPLNFRQLRAAAKAAHKPVEQYWMDTYQVQPARAAREAAEKSAYEARLIKQGADSEREKYISQYGNPDTRPLVPSTSPFTQRPATGRDKQPWETNTDPSNDRVRRATAKIMEMSH